MGDEVLSGLTALVGVVGARVGKRALHPVAVDLLSRLVGVLLDDREQIADQPLLGWRELNARLRRRLGRGDLVSRIGDVDDVDRGTVAIAV
jgi:hypothetical protein